MKEEYKELREDVFDEESAIKETIERLHKVRDQFNSRHKIGTATILFGTIFDLHFYQNCSPPPYPK